MRPLRPKLRSYSSRRVRRRGNATFLLSYFPLSFIATSFFQLHCSVDNFFLNESFWLRFKRGWCSRYLLLFLTVVIVWIRMCFSGGTELVLLLGFGGFFFLLGMRLTKSCFFLAGDVFGAHCYYCVWVSGTDCVISCSSSDTCWVCFFFVCVCGFLKLVWNDRRMDWMVYRYLLGVESWIVLLFLEWTHCVMECRRTLYILFGSVWKSLWEVYSMFSWAFNPL